jgi:hypothetical protein
MTRDTWETLARSARQLGLDCEALHARITAKLAADTRAPLPPDVLASALQDRIHETSGKLISASPLKDLAPSPPPHTEQPPTLPPSVESSEPADTAAVGQGLTLPPGWRATTHEDANSPENYEHTSKRCVWGPHGDGWSYCSRPPFGVADGHAPTMLQAMCAALGINVREYNGHWSAQLAIERGTDAECFLCIGATDADTCARLALERHHARQQAKTPERAQSIAERNAITVGDLLGLRTDADREAIAKAADDFIAQAADDYERCQCWVGHDSRRPSRWCPVDGHAAEWRTFAEQGTPDLSAEERGHA